MFLILAVVSKNKLKITKTIVKYLNSKSKVEVIKNKNKIFNQDIFMNINKAKKKLEFKQKTYNV